jgi:hypothetical protein
MKNRIWVICLMGMVMAGSGVGKTTSGLIFHGLDTINTKNQFGFDFVTQQSCTTFIITAPFSCVNHFTITIDMQLQKYIFSPDNQDGPAYCISIGKLNLDSIKVAPPDSIFLKQPNGHGDDIPVDSLSTRVGNVYILKTGIDPRPAWNNAFYAKIKILKFIVIDSAQHQIKMVFLWAFNRSGYPDLTTSGLDTFHLDGTSALPPNRPSASHANLSSVNKHVFTVATSRFTLPQDLITSNTFVTIYDLSGKTLCRLAPGSAGTIDLRRMGAAGKVFLIRVEN